jgi:hypothetical protein
VKNEVWILAMLALLLDSSLKLLHGGCAVRVASGQLKSKAIVLIPGSFTTAGKDTRFRWMRLEIRPPEDHACEYEYHLPGARCESGALIVGSICWSG